VLVVLAFWTSKKKEKDYSLEHNFPAVVLLIIIPFTSYLTYLRNKTNKKSVKDRLSAEKSWVDVLVSLSHMTESSTSSGHNFSINQTFAFDRMFTGVHSHFLGPHRRARDWMNDTIWVSTWLSIICYTVFLTWGAFALVSSRAELPNTYHMEAGEYSVLLKIFHKFGMYLTRLTKNWLATKRGLEALRKVSNLMNIGLAEMLKEGSDSPVPPNATSCAIKLRGVIVGEAKGRFYPLKMRADQEVSFPIGRIVHIKATCEGETLTCCGLLAGKIRPLEGTVEIPTFTSTLMNPAHPPSPANNVTVLETLQLAGAPKLEAGRFASVLGLSPDLEVSTLPLGQAKVLSLADAMLRDADILILPFPVSGTPHRLRMKIFKLLRLWHLCGGAKAILERLSDDKVLSAPFECDSKDCQVQLKTLVFTHSERYAHSSDLIIDLDAALVADSESSPRPQPETVVEVVHYESDI